MPTRAVQGVSSMSDSLSIGSNDPAVSFLSLDSSLGASQLDKREVGMAYYNLAKLYYDKSDLDQAYDYFSKAFECAIRPKDLFSMLKMTGFLIRIGSEMLDDVVAEKHITIASGLIEELSDVLGSLSSEYFYHLGVVKNYLGDSSGAKENFILSLKKSREENEPELLSKCLLALAVAEYNLKNYELALDYMKQLNELLSILNKNYMYGALHYHSAKIYTELGQYAQALESYNKANQFLQIKKCWNLYGYILLGKGVVYKKLGNFEKALTFFSMAKNINDPRTFKRLNNLIEAEIADVNDSNVDIYLDRTNRKIVEKTLGTIDFKHRFVLLEILFLLAKNPGEYFDKEKLARFIWKDEYNPLIHDKLIYTSVSRLRKLIEPKSLGSSKRKYIIRGKDGYTFDPDVKIRFHLEVRPSRSKPLGNVDLSSPV